LTNRSFGYIFIIYNKLIIKSIMPNFDKTGPQGGGPNTGRGMGAGKGMGARRNPRNAN
jgi:hypothetical protein